MNRKTLFFLSIVILVALLTTVILTNTLSEPLAPETVTAETVGWNMSRPTETIVIDKFVNNSYSGETVLVDFCVHVAGYLEDWPILPYGDVDSVEIAIYANVSLSQGFIHSVTVRFSQSNDNRFLDIIDDPDVIRLNNLTGRGIWDDFYSDEAYFKAMAVNEAAKCSLMFKASWMFSDQNNENHFETIALESIFFDGSIYRKVVIPIQLKFEV